MEITANDLLQQYDIQSLQQMARAHDLRLSGNKKATFVGALTKTLYDPARIARALADLSAAERTMLDRVILSGGETTTALLRRQLEGDGIVDPPQRTTRYGLSYYQQERGSYRNRNSREFEDLVARLGAHGLAFAIGPSRGSRTTTSLQEPGSRLIIPDEIRKHLPAATLTTDVAAAPEEVHPGDASALLRDLYLLFSIVDREKIALTNRGLVMKRSLTRIGQVLGRESEVAVVKSEDQLAGFSLLRGLAQALGLLTASVGELLLDPRGEIFLKLPANDRHQRLWDAYQTTNQWSELHRVPDLTVRGKGLTIYSPPANVVPARQRVLVELRELPAGEWIAIEHLISRLRMRAYEFLFSRTPASNTFYAVNYHYHGFGYYNPYHSSINGLGVTLDIDDEGRGWNVAEAGFVRVVVTEALHALGVVDLGGNGTEVSAFRITEVGRRLLASEPLAADETPAHVVVQPNFQVFAFQPTGEDVLFMLDRIADRVRTGQAMEYELTQASIFRAQQAGLETAAIVEFLERVSTHELPQNVCRTLEEWGAQHERITLRKRVPVLQTTTEAALDVLYADAALAPYLGRRLAPTLALIPTEQLRFVYHRMIDHGLLATLSEGPAYQPGPQLRIDGDGSLRFRHAQPSIFALHELRSFADDVDEDPKLTPDSLRRGAKAGLDADAIIATLERLSGGTLADEPAALVRRWAKDWGGGAIYDATILQLDKPEQLTDLLADPQVRSHLQPIPGAPTLAIVQPKSRKRLWELLEARGMALRDP